MSEIKALEKLREKTKRDVNNPWEDLKGSLLALCDKLEDEISERFMELPVDADGVPIHVGDVMVGWGERPETVGAVSDGGFNDAPLWCARDWHHKGPRTVEDVLHDFWEEWESHPIDAEWGVRLECLRESEAKYADEMRELMGGAK